MELCIFLGIVAEKFEHYLQHAKWALHTSNTTERQKHGLVKVYKQEIDDV